MGSGSGFLFALCDVMHPFAAVDAPEGDWGLCQVLDGDAQAEHLVRHLKDKTEQAHQRQLHAPEGKVVDEQRGAYVAAAAQHTHDHRGRKAVEGHHTRVAVHHDRAHRRRARREGEKRQHIRPEQRKKGQKLHAAEGEREEKCREAHGLADAGHDVHVEHDVNGVGQFKAVFGERRADDGHGVRNDVHRAALVGAVGESVHLLVHFLGVHPVVGGTGVLLALTADEGAVLDAGDIVRVGAVEIAAGELILVELDEDALLDGLLPQRLELFLLTGDPDDLVRLRHGGHFLHPLENGLVFREGACRVHPLQSGLAFGFCHLVSFLFSISARQMKRKFLPRGCVVRFASRTGEGADRCTEKNCY